MGAPSCPDQWKTVDDHEGRQGGACSHQVTSLMCERLQWFLLIRSESFHLLIISASSRCTPAASVQAQDANATRCD